MTRGFTLAVVAIGLVGCDPQIVSGAYLCGPQMTCPKGEVCSAADGTCVRPDLARPFECMPGAQGGEPNEDATSATPLVIAACPTAQVERLGCLPAPSDVDFVVVTAPPTCAGGALEIDVRYTAAFEPVTVDLMAPGGSTVAATATPCDITGGLGANDAACLSTTVPSDGRSVIRVTLDPAAGLTCDGACDFAQYSVTAVAQSP